MRVDVGGQPAERGTVVGAELLDDGAGACGRIDMLQGADELCDLLAGGLDPGEVRLVAG